VENIVAFLQTLSPALVLLILFAIAFVENIFPPSPSDIVIVFGGSLVGLGRVGFVEALLCATAGSTLGFVAMYKIGDWFGAAILEKGKVGFIPPDAVRKVDEWFRKYGYGIIIANRFLAGTRAVVSFFAGMAKLRLAKTTALCLLSALAWNAILLGGGFYLGNNWERIGVYLSTYSQIVTALLIVIVLLLVARFLYRKNGGGRTA
jgi:membrane protein DedA with SNARE-associated domain